MKHLSSLHHASGVRRALYKAAKVGCVILGSVLGTVAHSTASQAQNIIILRAGIGGRVTLPTSATVAIPIVIDMSSAGGLRIASLSATVAWTPTKLRFDSLVAGSFGSVTSNTSSAGNGDLGISVFDATGTTSTVTVATLYFTSTSGAATVTVTPSAAGDATGTSIRANVRVRRLEACIAQGGLWGDVNNDGAVNIVDAQQIARASVALSVANPTALAALGDVTADNEVNILDAQQIARFTVGLSTTARTNTSVFVPPTAVSASVLHVFRSVGVAYDPYDELSGARYPVPVGGQALIQILALDNTGADITACVTPSFNAFDASSMPVSADGVVTAVAPSSSNVVVSAGATAGSPALAVYFSVPGSLLLTTAPAGATSLAPFTTQPVVTLSASTASGVPITATFGYNEGQETLAGTTTVYTVNGVATFTDLRILGGSRHSLQFSSPSLYVGSPFFRVEAAGLQVGTQPSASATNGSAFGTQPVIVIRNDNNATITGANGVPVTASIVSGNGTLTGNTVVSAVNGVATFTNLGINGTGTHILGFTTTGATSVNSAAIAVAAGSQTPTSLAVARAAAGIFNGAPFQVQPIINIRDAIGTTVEGSTAPVTISLAGGSGTLSGTTTVNAVNGVATFTNVALAGTGSFTLSYGSPGLPAVNTASFSFDSAPVLTTGTHTCVLYPSAYCRGQGVNGELGNGSLSSSTTPVPVSGGHNFMVISSGLSTTCAVDTANSAWCWGAERSGALGNGTTTSTHAPTPTAVSGGLSFASVSSGDGFSCGLTTSSQAYCWGQPQYGVLGRPDEGTTYSTPGAVSGGLTFTSVVTSANSNHVCGVALGNAAYCWGRNTQGQLGNGATANASSPQPVSGGLILSSVAVGFMHSCGLTTAGAAYCWGDNLGYQGGANFGLGDGRVTGPYNTPVGSTTPVAVAGGLSFVSIVAGDRFTCALTAAGKAYCWGSHSLGAIGDGTAINGGSNQDVLNTRLTPTAVAGGVTFVSITAGYRTVCGVANTGVVYCWGQNFGTAPTVVPHP